MGSNLGKIVFLSPFQTCLSHKIIMEKTLDFCKDNKQFYRLGPIGGSLVRGMLRDMEICHPKAVTCLQSRGDEQDYVSFMICSVGYALISCENEIETCVLPISTQ